MNRGTRHGMMGIQRAHELLAGDANRSMRKTPAGARQSPSRFCVPFMVGWSPRPQARPLRPRRPFQGPATGFHDLPERS